MRCTTRIELDPGDDSGLIVRAREGDQVAFGALVRRYQTDAVRLAFAICARQADAEDAAQAAFVKAHRALGRFDTARPFRPWLMRIVANEAKNVRRSQTRRVALVDKQQQQRPPVEASVEEVVLIGVDADRLVRAIAALDDNDRAVIGYRWFAQLNEAEMALALDCPKGTVKSRLARAMGRLRAELTSGGDQ